MQQLKPSAGLDRLKLVSAAAAHEVTNLRVFGSLACGEDRPGSDVDLLVDPPPTRACSVWDESRPTWRPSSAPRSTWYQPAISSPPSAPAPSTSSWPCDRGDLRSLTAPYELAPNAAELTSRLDQAAHLVTQLHAASTVSAPPSY